MYIIKGLPKNVFGPSVAMHLLIGLSVEAKKKANLVFVKITEIVEACKEINRMDAAEFFARATFEDVVFEEGKCIEC